MTEWQNYDLVAPPSNSCRSWTQVLCSRSSKWLRRLWMLQFYIVWQRCLLDMPYHKYHLLLISACLAQWGPAEVYLQELRGGLSFTAEVWQQERAASEPSQSKLGKITPKFQWHNDQNQSRACLCLESWEMSSQLEWGGGEDGHCREITYLHHQPVSVMKKYNWFLTACWLQGVTWWGFRMEFD